MAMLFSASTIRVRWLHGSPGAENSVMMERLLDTIPLPRLSYQPSFSPYSTGSAALLLDVLPEFTLQEPRQPGEDQQEEHHPDPHCMAHCLLRVADIIQEVHQVVHELIELLRRHAAGCDLLEVIEDLLLDHLSVRTSRLDGLVDGNLQPFERRDDIRHGALRERQV